MQQWTVTLNSDVAIFKTLELFSIEVNELFDPIVLENEKRGNEVFQKPNFE